MFADSVALPRWKAFGSTWGLDLRLRRLRREESAALERAGRGFRPVPARPEAAWSAPVAEALARVAELEEHERELARRLAASLEADRRDYRATDAELGRWLIVVRGVLDRLVVRDEAWRARRELPRRYAELGARVMADPEAAEALPAEDRARAASAQKARRDAAAEREALLAPYGGQALPGALRVALAESASLLEFVREELSKKIFLRLPALAAMGAAWWATHHLTVSRRDRWLDGLLGKGPSLSEAGAEWLSFWLPLLAAALVAYLISTLEKRVRRRYLGEERSRAPDVT